jgi:hypothetical protein
MAYTSRDVNEINGVFIRSKRLDHSLGKKGESEIEKDVVDETKPHSGCGSRPCPPRLFPEPVSLLEAGAVRRGWSRLTARAGCGFVQSTLPALNLVLFKKEESRLRN